MKQTTFLFAALLLVATALPARAATRTVNTLADVVSATDGKLSLREAITASVAGDAIRFSVAGALVLTKGELLITRVLTIQGPGARALTLSGNNKSRIFRVRGTTLTISGLTTADGLHRGQDGADGGVGEGGALYVGDGGRVSVSHSAFINNSAIGGNSTTGRFAGHGLGGAIFTELGTILEVRNCTFSGNNARNGSGGASFSTLAQGGAIFNGGDALVLQSTLVGNFVSLDQKGEARGGALFGSFGPVTMTGCTVTNNACFSGGAGSVGGGLASFGQQAIRLLNTVVAGNRTPAADPDVTGRYSSQGYNLIGITGASTGWAGLDLLGDAASPVDPLFEADFNGNPYVRDNGGPTDTVALQPDSAALNAGDNAVTGAPLKLLTDQRGWPRLGGPRVDIGAHEGDPAQPGPSFVVTTRDDHDDGTPGVFDCTLREALNASVAGTKTVTFKAGLTGAILLEPALGTLFVNEPVNVRGPGASKLTLSGGGQVRILRNFAPAVTLSGLSFLSGSDEGSGSGAGIVNAGTLTLDGCVLRSCRVSGSGGDGGGAIMNTAPSRVTLRNCSLYSNSAPTRGGAIANLGGTVTLVNTTVTGNSSPRGGGIANGGNDGIYPRGTVSLLNCTVGRNGASSGGGGVLNDPTNVLSARNSIFALNTAPVGRDVSGGVNSQGNNVVGKRDGSAGWVASDRQGTVAAPLDPKLGGRAANGGETPTLALLAGSPAINAANAAAAPPTDQRGFYRSGAPDIGAFEFGGIKPRPPVNVSVTPSAGSGGVGIIHTITAKYSDPDGASNLTAVYLLINSTLNPKNAIYVCYNAVTNRLFMRNAADTAWLGNAVPGSGAVITASGSQGRLHCSGVTVQKVGTTLTITWSVSAANTFGGLKKVYLFSQDAAGLSDGWDQLGTWTYAQ